MNLTRVKKRIALLLCMAMVFSASVLAIFAGTTGWFGNPDCFEPIDDTLDLTWVPDAARKINLLDCSFNDWDRLNLPTVTITRDNVVSWINDGYVPANSQIDLRFAADGEFLYMAVDIVDVDIVDNYPVYDPLDSSNLVNYNTGDCFQLGFDFGNKIRGLIENDPEAAEMIMPVFYSVGFRGDGADVYVSVQGSDDDRILGVGDAVNVNPDRADIDAWYITDTGTKGKTWLTNTGWAAEFCIPFSEMYYDYCYKSYNDGWNDMIANSIVIDEYSPLEIGMNFYYLDWISGDGYYSNGLASAYSLHNGYNVDYNGRPIVTWTIEDMATELSLEYVDGMEFTSPYLLTPDSEVWETEVETWYETDYDYDYDYVETEYIVDRANKLTYLSYGNGTCSLVYYDEGETTAYTAVDLVIPSRAPNGDRVTEIDDYTFSHYSTLRSIELPNTITEIGDYAFYYCTKLRTIYYNGTPSQWSAIRKGYAWDYGTSYTLSYIEIETETATDRYEPDPWYPAESEYESEEDVVIRDELTGLTYISNRNGTCYVDELETSRYGSEPTEVVIPTKAPNGDTVTGIGYGAFSGRDSLTSVVIPASVTSIGEFAFAWCENLSDIYYSGTEAQWRAIQKGENWDYHVGWYAVIYNYGVNGETEVETTVETRNEMWDETRYETKVEPNDETTSVTAKPDSPSAENPTVMRVGCSAVMGMGSVLVVLAAAAVVVLKKKEE